MVKEIRKVNRSGATIGTLVQIPRGLSLRLARVILDKAERGQQLTKTEMIIGYIENGINQETK